MSLKPLAAATLLALVSNAASASSDRYVIQVDDSKKGVVKALVKQLGGDINLESSGFLAATFTGKDLEQVKGLLNNPHITLVEQDQVRKLMSFSDDLGDPAVQQVTPYAVYQSQADQLTLQMQNAKKVCVIDSGIARETGETGGYNPDFDWSVITGNSDSGTNDWFRDGGPHGTHVAGTIAAADNTYGVIGMAPGNPLHIIKVFNDAGWGYSSDLAHAANLCSQAGAKIISMSLGGGGANSTEENAFKSFTAAGGLVVAAAGNDGNNVRSYPAGYSSVMMIGANDANNNIADFSQFPSCTTGRGKNVTNDETICVEATAGGVDTLSTYPGGGATLSSMTAGGADFASSPMENVGSASGQTFFMGTAESTNSGAAGKICMIDRGVISFHDKVKNCENSGGIGAVIINNAAGMLYGTLGDVASNTTSIPAVGAALEDRTALLAAGSATVDVGAADYGYMSGTSMATPAVSGVAALVWSNHPSCTGTEIRNALKATALDAGAAGKDEYFGYGIVQAKAASDYLTANGCAGGNNGGGTPGALQLTASGYKVKGFQVVDLSWSGAAGSSVDIYRNGVKVVTTANDGAHTDSLNVKGTGSYSYQVCEAGKTTCSATKNVVF
ncbi:S8 family serine peptidase [Aliiglaciecola sp. CAU 1673]|uniref:S8 family serine peptidase n=1 Tax=Aliiglaciecola sp. CAU 1673 TaxID=3032595 RepID=UPI0023DA5059|nr:S8 family serine peptidase [Aliiglaciecola sp. CAU 1673]MDF2178525.1 S8 family serine peptidase [Aliiglaciecola sp. CAU 1673]